VRVWSLRLVALGIFFGFALNGQSALGQTQPKGFQQGLILGVTYGDDCYDNAGVFNCYASTFCVQVDDIAVVGYRLAFPLWWGPEDLTRFNKQKVWVRFTDDSVTIIPEDGKKRQFRRQMQEGTDKRFAGSSDCVEGLHRTWLTKIGMPSRPSGLPADAVLVPTSGSSYDWESCRFDPKHNWDLCTVWYWKATRPYEYESVNSIDHRAVRQEDLQIDPLTSLPYEIRLKNGILLHDWAKGRVITGAQNTPDPTSIPPLPPL
jgi:hypothetical protein